jgi:hypothetical protein
LSAFFFAGTYDSRCRVAKSFVLAFTFGPLHTTEIRQEFQTVSWRLYSWKINKCQV